MEERLNTRHSDHSSFLFHRFNLRYCSGSVRLFTMLVVMALVTTMCTTPILNLLGIPRANVQKLHTGLEQTQPPALHP